MSELITYGGLFLVLFLIGSGGVYLKRKFDIKDAELEFVGLLMEVVDFITQQFEYKYKDDVTKIVQYVIEALLYIEQFEATSDVQLKRDLIREKALIIAENEGIDLESGEVIEIVDRIVDYLMG